MEGQLARLGVELAEYVSEQAEQRHQIEVEIACG
jgi:hypothetical protein